MENYFDLLEQVNSKESFLRFLTALVEDWNESQEKKQQSLSSPFGPDANDWENPSLGRFLEAMIVWSRSTSTLTGQPFVSEQPSWRTFAEMFAAAKIYE